VKFWSAVTCYRFHRPRLVRVHHTVIGPQITSITLIRKNPFRVISWIVFSEGQQNDPRNHEPNLGFLIGVICVICGPILVQSKAVRAALSADRMSALHLLLPNDRIAPQEMFLDLCAGKDLGTEGVDFFHRRVDVVALVCGPGGAGGAVGEQAAVVNQS
jgi:hypothetical protein